MVLLEGKGHGAAWGKRARCCLGEKGTVLLGGKGTELLEGKRHGAAWGKRAQCCLREKGTLTLGITF